MIGCKAFRLKWSVFLCRAAAFFLTSCCFSVGGSASPAPVVEAWHQPQASHTTVVVRRGDTLYSIAWAFRLDYTALAQANGLKPPYRLQVGQRLRLVGERGGASQPPPAHVARYADRTRVAPIVQATPVGQRASTRQAAPTLSARPQSKAPAPSIQSSRTAPPRTAVMHPVPAKGQWLWPAVGKVQQKSDHWYDKNGISILGQQGEAVRVAASGEVVYSGNGLRGYGNLIIVKHNAHYLSAYAFNQRNLVKIGQQLKSGQAIARMGVNPAGLAMVHFEIRRNGRSINPMRYLSHRG